MPLNYQSNVVAAGCRIFHKWPIWPNDEYDQIPVFETPPPGAMEGHYEEWRGVFWDDRKEGI